MRFLTLCFLILMACKGPRGNDGSSGRSIIGPTGSQGVQGQTGPSGSQGIPGLPGSQGPAGLNGVDTTPVTWVQFCAGVPSYPSTFIEGGFCINGNVYAVYSANDGFMTYLPPGSYNSNAINSSCTFTLLDNCIVQ